jgi:hypothetical protein
MVMKTIRNLLVATALLAEGWCNAQLGVTTAEYFWDTDPGEGSGIALTAADGAFGEALEQIQLNTGALPSTGTHRLYIRAKDEDNGWGPLFSTIIEIFPGAVSFPDIAVTEAEYFWDTDPGEGNGTAMLAFDGNFNAALESIRLDAASLPADGTHVLNIRARDANNDWGAVFSAVVDVMPGSVSFPSISVSAAEYWFDIDPGEGTATPMLAFDGNFNSALERLVGGDIPVPVDQGVHVLWMRSRDANSDWGPPFGIVVNMDTTIQGTVGLPEVEADASVQLLPNPTDGATGCMVRLTGADRMTRVDVYDVQGNLVVSVPVNGASQVLVPMVGAAAGVYPVRIHSTGGVHTARIVVN